MRYTINEQPTILGKFATGATVTIALYDLFDESAETLTSNSCNELGSTGVYYWSTSNITTQPTAFTEYCWVMTDGTSSQYGKIVLGGYPENLDQSLSDMEDNIRGGSETLESLNTAIGNIEVDNEAIADAVWDKPENEVTTSGSIGKFLKDLISIILGK